MQLRTDHAFHLGRQHRSHGLPCQDYARSGSLADRSAYAIVSDGCSSGGNTDIGARLITLSMEQALNDGLSSNPASVTHRMYGYLNSVRRLLAVPECDLLATLLTATVHPSGVAYATILGDGVLAYADDDVGDIFALKYEWAQNMPFYPAYHGESRTQFEAYHSAHTAGISVEEWRITPTPYQLKHRTRMLSVWEGMNGVTWSHDCRRGPENNGHRTIALFSDGVMHVDGYSWQEVIGHLMAFKNTRGRFATRRMNRFLLNADRCGNGPLDDIAMAVVHLDQVT